MEPPGGRPFRELDQPARFVYALHQPLAATCLPAKIAQPA
jgi:hypothetical protein